MRLFIAIPFPESLLDTLEGLRQTLRREFATLKADIAWVKPEHSHLTLRFFGDVTSAQETALRQGMESLAVPVFHASLGALGTFPATGPLRILQIGLSSGNENVLSLAAQTETLARAVGFPGETRTFSPHITLGRVRHLRDTAGARAKLAAMEAPAAGFPVHTVELIESKLTPRGAEYTTLAQRVLATSPKQ